MARTASRRRVGITPGVLNLGPKKRLLVKNSAARRRAAGIAPLLGKGWVAPDGRVLHHNNGSAPTRCAAVSLVRAQRQQPPTVRGHAK